MSEIISPSLDIGTPEEIDAYARAAEMWINLAKQVAQDHFPLDRRKAEVFATGFVKAAMVLGVFGELPLEIAAEAMMKAGLKYQWVDPEPQIPCEQEAAIQ